MRWHSLPRLKVIGGLLSGGTLASVLRKVFEVYHALVALTANFGNQKARIYLTFGGSTLEYCFLELAHSVAELVCNPDVGPVKGHSIRDGADGKGAQRRAIAGPQPAHSVAVGVRHPDVGPVEGYSKMTDGGADGKGAQHCAVAGTQLIHIPAVLVPHPDVSPIKGNCHRAIADGKGAQHRAIAGTQLAHAVGA